MSKLAKIMWLIAGLSLATLVTTRYILGGWTTDILFVPLGAFLLATLVALVVDYKFYLEFVTLRTTKHGMNMGALILLVIVVLVGVNYFGKKYSKTWDLTEEKLHTLAEQTKTVLDNLNSDLQVLVFYRGEKDQNSKQQIKQIFSMYQDYSSKVKVRNINAYVENELAENYLKGLGDAEQAIVFIENGNKRIRVEPPFNEQNITPAIIRATRDKNKTVYFLTGHGERDLTSDDQEGLAIFKQSLEDSAFIVKDFSLFEKQEVPEDADIVAIVGPKLQILEGERKALLDFARRGGRLFVAADPGEKHQIALLTKSFGVEYKNNYILDVGMNRLMGRGIAGILGLVFDSANDITKKFIGRQGFTIFDKVSEVIAASDKDEDIKTFEIVKSAGSSFLVNELKNIKQPTEKGSYSLAVLAEGKLKSDDKSSSGQEFAAIFFGDSDFVAQKDIINGFNIDLALNAISYLAKETDLISIAPKAPKGTQLTLTSVKGNVLVACGVAIPLLFFIFSGVMWFRRRGA